jgi:glycosyltransferase involved in cell wall biosynthesis
VIYIGAINRNRGAIEILETVKYLKKKKTDIRFLFLGHISDTNLKIQMETYIKDNDLYNNIIMKEPVPYTEVSEYLSKAKIGIGIFMPTKIYFNAVQVKTFEYMVHGLPIVCSNFGYINKFVSDSEAGIAVNPKSPEETSNAILKILNNDKLYMEYSRNGKKAVQEKYNWKIMENKLFDIYSSVLNINQDINE